MNLSESKDFLVSSSSLKDVRTFSREVFDKINLPQEQKDEKGWVNHLILTKKI